MAQPSCLSRGHIIVKPPSTWSSEEERQHEPEHHNKAEFFEAALFAEVTWLVLSKTIMCSRSPAN
jgi:hypothetical protein